MNFINGKLNCTSPTQFNTSEFVQCLKRKSFAELHNVGSEYQYSVTDTHQRLLIAPSIDGDLITADPDVLLSDKNSYLDSIGVIHVNLTEGISKEFLCETFSQDMAKSYFKNSPKAAKALCDKYSYHGNEDKLVQ
ncbi:hypothetical protein KUTeg_011899 [Tegillarca granosa]|uniref:Transferrin n=1 Tax=Tegillarca granosa TaxID=220873 RepID=A0ABQ9EY77_TEGGR|nr:hypothetical protein KUTeg_011899 [Tegillarca granosa]